MTRARLALCATLAACSGGAAKTDAGANAAAPVPVLVHLFGWRWTDVARECETSLGPAGFTGVQIAPPSEHVVLPGAPWWQRYQTVSYSVAQTDGGTGDELRDMVRRCAAAGVGVWVDAVVNHTTGQASGTGSNGTAFTKYTYGALYGATDFHAPPCAIANADYASAPERVRRCELLGLADLDTGSDGVRAKIAGYLSAMVDEGVTGFRIDAAKHIDPADLDAIRAKVSGDARYFFEVIDHGGEAIRASDYVGAPNVDVTEFKFDLVSEAFRARTLADLRALADPAAIGFLPSDRALVFVNNHDTQRASGLFYQDGARYDLATIFLLASPYGHPSLLSSYGFDRATDAGRSVGPPAEAPDCGVLAPASAKSGWLCEHRRPYVAPMIAFRREAASEPTMTNWWDDGLSAVAFGRGARGFVVLNAGTTPVSRTFATSLTAGKHRDVLGGAAVDVDSQGQAAITVAAESAIVLKGSP
jgi:alpha-amylase